MTHAAVSLSGDRQAPTSGKPATTYADLMAIVTHPALRIGFLDAQAGKSFDHEDIMGRIERETDQRALARIAWPWGGTAARQSLFGEQVDASKRHHAVELAQYRYEEGRIAVIALGLRCRAWGHPDYPPKAIIDFIWARVDAERNAA